MAWTILRARRKALQHLYKEGARETEENISDTSWRRSDRIAAWLSLQTLGYLIDGELIPNLVYLHTVEYYSNRDMDFLLLSSSTH